MHRGTSLIYGKIEPAGIRCPYHGWLFDAEGRCLETPCEPESPVRHNIRQPWYPVVEHYGLLFTYMGPADRQPLLPRISVFEDVPDDEEIVATGSHLPPAGQQALFAGHQDFNWWQFYDNFMDPFHVYALHSRINGVQFVASLTTLPDVTTEQTADGVRTIQHRRTHDGRILQRLSQTVLPNINCTATVTDDLGPAGVSWTVAVDDTHSRTFGLQRVKKDVDLRHNMSVLGMLQPGWGPGKPYADWTLEDHQRWQTDYVTQKGQGDVNLHSDEHLTRIDRATAMIRRLFKQQADRVAAGEDPVGATRDEPYLIRVTAGNALLDGATLACLDGYDGR
jgi:phenylpropionate dioxygenase-like ring-hydroxylating dioxygenase large terminal subunit